MSGNEKRRLVHCDEQLNDPYFFRTHKRGLLGLPTAVRRIIPTSFLCCVRCPLLHYLDARPWRFVGCVGVCGCVFFLLYEAVRSTILCKLHFFLFLFLFHHFCFAVQIGLGKSGGHRRSSDACYIYTIEVNHVFFAF